MRTLDVIQGTEEWKVERAGKFTASRIADLIAKTKSGPAASRKNYLAELLIERMTGQPSEHFVSKEMAWGTEHEPEARTIYEFERDLVEQVGFVLHPEYDFAGASPDGLVGTEGGIEIKCPNSATHIETLQTRKVPSRYYAQMQWCMECCEREWWDYVSYDPRMRDPRLTMFVTRVNRDDGFIAAVREEIERAEEELSLMVFEMEQLAKEVAS
jgi:putative phage-type endonuclease